MVDRKKIYFAEHLLVRKEDFGYLLYRINDGKTYICNEVGKLIIDECKMGANIVDVIKKICHRYPEVDKDLIKKDVTTFFQEMISKKIIYSR